MAESLFSRLQKLNKEATPPNWWISRHPDNVEHFVEPEVATVEDELKDADAALIVECRNSLPAVLNLIEAALPVSEWDELPNWETVDQAEKSTELLRQLHVLREAVAVFVSRPTRHCPACGTDFAGKSTTACPSCGRRVSVDVRFG